MTIIFSCNSVTNKSNAPQESATDMVVYNETKFPSLQKLTLLLENETNQDFKVAISNLPFSFNQTYDRDKTMDYEYIQTNTTNGITDRTKLALRIWKDKSHKTVDISSTVTDIYKLYHSDLETLNFKKIEIPFEETANVSFLSFGNEAYVALFRDERIDETTSKTGEGYNMYNLIVYKK
jgi:hypothetical protein